MSFLNITGIEVSKEAFEDLNNGADFYDLQEVGLGDYFWSALDTDMNSLVIHAGVHKKQYSLYRMLSQRFPLLIYSFLIFEMLIY
jgi:hypothetical protein